jgi:pimeloyl-ACP methyl ester carboxylesterase
VVNTTGTAKNGTTCLPNPSLTRAAAYTEAKRQALGIVGLVRGVAGPEELQMRRVMMRAGWKPLRLARGMSLFLGIVSLLFAGCALAKHAEESRVQNIVLVHGAWADGSGWRAVYDILVADGYNVTIVQEPLTSFQDDVAATKRVLAQQNGPCVLVAHSYGGSVITEAGTDPSVAGLVYIAAHMPDAGEARLTEESASQVTSASLVR